MDVTPKQSTLEELSNDISAAAKLISAYSLVAEIQPPSFGPDSPAVIIPSHAPQNVLKAQQTLIQAAAKIQQLVTEPSEYIPGLQVHVSSWRVVKFPFANPTTVSTPVLPEMDVPLQCTALHTAGGLCAVLRSSKFGQCP